MTDDFDLDAAIGECLARSPDPGAFTKWIFPVIQRTMPELNVRDLVTEVLPVNHVEVTVTIDSSGTRLTTR